MLFFAPGGDSIIASSIFAHSFRAALRPNAGRPCEARAIASRRSASSAACSFSLLHGIGADMILVAHVETYTAKTGDVKCHRHLPLWHCWRMACAHSLVIDENALLTLDAGLRA